jgi:hypothetical protein
MSLETKRSTIDYLISLETKKARPSDYLISYCTFCPTNSTFSDMLVTYDGNLFTDNGMGLLLQKAYEHSKKIGAHIGPADKCTSSITNIIKLEPETRPLRLTTRFMMFFYTTWTDGSHSFSHSSFTSDRTMNNEARLDYIKKYAAEDMSRKRYPLKVSKLAILNLIQLDDEPKFRGIPQPHMVVKSFASDDEYSHSEAFGGEPSRLLDGASRFYDGATRRPKAPALAYRNRIRTA